MGGESFFFLPVFPFWTCPWKKISVSLDTVESEGLTEGVLISCTSSKLSASESTDSRLFGVKADVDEGGLSIEVTLFLDGIFDPSGLNSWKETL